MTTEKRAPGNFKYIWLFLLIFIVPFLSSSVAHSGGETFTLTILHLNDTHSHLDPNVMSYACVNHPYRLEVGGFARLASAIGDIRSTGKPLLFLHAGDMVQGTLYYTKYQGRADIDLLNMMGLDAATLGNHDFDGGAESTARLLQQASFSVVSANVNASREPLLAGRIKPYILKTFSGRQVAIIGATTPYTPSLSHPGGRIVFKEVSSRVAAVVKEVQAKGVNKIILLTHIGYNEDVQLARTVPGIDVIIGGHSHTLLGGQAGNSRKFRSAGLKIQPSGDYPTVITGPGGQTVLVAQAWEWGKLLGDLEVTFDDKGEVRSWQGHPLIVAGDPVASVSDEEKTGTQLIRTEQTDACLPSVVKRYKKDPRMQARLSFYTEPLDSFQHVRIAEAIRDLKREDDFGPGQLVAESMLWKTRHLNTRAALQNVGGVRCDIPAGGITVRTIYELLPFANTIYVVELTGRQLRRTLEQMMRSRIVDGRSQLIYTAGISFQVDRQAAFGNRVHNLRIRGAKGDEPVVPTGHYRIAVQNYLAGGGDGCKTLKHAGGYRYDTGYVDTDVFMEYLKQLPDGHVPPAMMTGK